MNVCTCFDLSPSEVYQGESPEETPVCIRCGQWYSLKHGSRPVGEKFDVDKAIASGMVIAGPNWRKEWDRPLRRSFRGGPNDPCPCGSGKKAKKCCL